MKKQSIAFWLVAALVLAANLSCVRTAEQVKPTVKIAPARSDGNAKGNPLRTNDASFRFTVTGDPRNELTKWEHTLKQITDKVGDEGVFHITCGDYFHHGSVTVAQDFYDLLKKEFGDDVVWYPTVGNHETQEDSTDMEWLRRFYHDHLNGTVNPGPRNGVETTYSFDYQNAHFVQLNQYYDGRTDKHQDGEIRDALYDWLVKDLEKNTKPLVFVIYHAPLFPEGRGGKDYDGESQHRWRFWNLLRDKKVTAAFCADTHTYGRGQFAGNPYTWEIDVGNAGRQSHADPHQTFVDVIVTGTEVRFNAWQGLEDEEFKITDYWSVKGAEVTHSWTAPQAKPKKAPPVPQAVQDAIKAFAQGAEIDDIEREKENGKIVYVADIEKGDIEIEVMLSLAGKILEVKEEEEIVWKKLLPAGRAALKKYEPNARPTEIKRRTSEGITIYEAEYSPPGVLCVVSLSSDGEIFRVRQTMRASRLPLAIRAELENRYPGATIKEVEVNTITTYDISLKKDRKYHEIQACATGEIEEDD